MFSCVGDVVCGIGISCEHPLEAGYRGRAILYPAAGVTITRDADQPRRIVSIALKNGYRAVRVDNVNLTPFAGSATTGNGDAGYPKFQKTLVVQVPQRGASVSAKVIEPLAFGRFVALVEMEQQIRDGAVQVLGSNQSLRVTDPSTITRQEDANGGAWSVTLQCTEQYAECTLYGTGAQGDPTPTELFETYWGAAEDSCL